MTYILLKLHLSTDDYDYPWAYASEWLNEFEDIEIARHHAEQDFSSDSSAADNTTFNWWIDENGNLSARVKRNSFDQHGLSYCIVKKGGAS